VFEGWICDLHLWMTLFCIQTKVILCLCLFVIYCLSYKEFLNLFFGDSFLFLPWLPCSSLLLFIVTLSNCAPSHFCTVLQSKFYTAVSVCVSVCILYTVYMCVCPCVYYTLYIYMCVCVCVYILNCIYVCLLYTVYYARTLCTVL
jgi:hypothetical protein